MAGWCCDQQYEACTQVKDAINVCETVFGSGNANVSIAEANAVESSSTSTTSSTILLSSYSGILSSRANAGSTSTTSATSSSQCLRISSIPCNHVLTYRNSRDLYTPTLGEPGHFLTLVRPLPRSHRRHRDRGRSRHLLRVPHLLEHHTR